MQELNVLTVDTLEVDKISRVLAISKDEQVVAMEPSGIAPDLSAYAKISYVDAIVGNINAILESI